RRRKSEPQESCDGFPRPPCWCHSLSSRKVAADLSLAAISRWCFAAGTAASARMTALEPHSPRFFCVHVHEGAVNCPGAAAGGALTRALSFCKDTHIWFGFHESPAHVPCSGRIQENSWTNARRFITREPAGTSVCGCCIRRSAEQLCPFRFRKRRS